MIKKDNADWFFLAVIIFHIFLELVIYFTPFVEIVPWNMATNLILSESVIWIPALFYFVETKQNPIETCRFRKIRPATVFMTVLFTMLCGPLTTVANAISMLFVENTVLSISGNVLEMPFPVMFLLMAVYGPLVEEVGFRGIIHQGFRSRGNVWKAILLSSFLFAIMHMNVNQAAYAFVLGIMMALLMEATDSIWPSFIMHMCINGFSVVVMFLTNALPAETMEVAMSEAVYSTQELFLVISIYLVLAVICTPLALCVLTWIAGHENRKEALAAILPNRKSSHSKLLTIPIIVGTLICFVMMIINQILV